VLLSNPKQIELDTRRKASDTIGEMKKRGELAEGRKPKLSQRGIVTLDDLGLTLNQSAWFQQEAAVPEKVFVAFCSS
jgi:hypothetical protein